MKIDAIPIRAHHRRSIRSAMAALGFAILLAPSPPPARGAAPPWTLDQIRDRVRQRRAAVKTFEGEIVRTRDAELEPPKTAIGRTRRLLNPHPMLETRQKIAWAEGKLRIDIENEITFTPELEEVPRSSILIQHRGFTKWLYWSGGNDGQPPQAQYYRYESRQLEFWYDADVILRSALTDNELDYHGLFVDIDHDATGAPLAILYRPRDYSGGRDELVLDPARDFILVGVRYRNYLGAFMVETRVEHRPDPTLGWTPIRAALWVNAGAERRQQDAAYVARLTLNPKLPADQFTLALPAGTDASILFINDRNRRMPHIRGPIDDADRWTARLLALWLFNLRWPES